MTQVKICGVTNLEDARTAADLGAWALGMIFWPGSPRACTLEAAEEIAGTLKRRVELAGVFVNASLDEVAATADRVGLTMLQLHGDEGPAFCAEAARRTGCAVMKAMRVKGRAELQDLRAFRTDYHLLDAYVPGSRGGTGKTFDWELARRHRARARLVVSGGLTSDNVGQAMAAAHPFAVDTASGTEAEPGRKDHAKVTAFFRAVEAADALAAA